MTTGFNDPNDSDSDDNNPLELMSYIASRSETKGKDGIEVAQQVEEYDSDYDPHRVTPTADYMIDVFATKDVDGSKQPPQSTALNSSQKTPTAQQAGGMVGLGVATASIAPPEHPSKQDALLNNSTDPNYAYAHVLNWESIQELKKNRFQYPHRTFDKIPTDHLTTHYKIIQRLGRGSFADVYKVSRIHHHSHHSTTSSAQTFHAIKKTRTRITGPKDRKFQLQELITQYTLTSQSPRHLIHLQTAWEQYASLYLVMEFCAGGTLQEYVERRSLVGGVDEFVIWGVLGQVAEGLREMHSCGVMHLDLKPGNILITGGGDGDGTGGGGVLKIGDFGCAAFFPVPEGFEREGDRTYIAPEVMESRYVKECDIFSLGLIIFEIATNIILPENGNHWQKLRRHDFSECAPQLNRVSPPLVELIKGMLHPVPEERISLDRILSHPFVVTIMEGSLFG
ncbi:UNVERIFIED_CONTAM: hypothetical protein HDU68_011539 [Siphonaria sp. JEL0065]|nr:hypothetical protein HDU68_011539 [Siphonaria sp. JEL0065]